MSESLVRAQRDLPVSRVEAFTEQFYQWELRGRGWSVWSYPVALEPPFRSMYLFDPGSDQSYADDARKPTFLSRLFQSSASQVQVEPGPAYKAFQQRMAEFEEAVVCDYLEEDFLELQLILPRELKVSKPVGQQFVSSLSYCSHPVSFEVIGNSDEIVIQIAATVKDRTQVEQQLNAYFPSALIREVDDLLLDRWESSDGESWIVDFGLSQEFLIPLAPLSNLDLDPLIAIVGAMAKLEDDEVGVFQVLFQKTRFDWASEMINALRFDDGSPFFGDAPELIKYAQQKVSSHLFAVVVRVAAKSDDERAAGRIVRSIASGLPQLANPLGNELIPLSNDGYNEGYHEQALLRRLSFRCGMILNQDELVSLVHPPSTGVRTEKLVRDAESTKAAPSLAIGHALTLGANEHQGETHQVTLSNDQRTRHLHLIGSSGSGKSTLLMTLIKQDLHRGDGLCVVDPHGDLIDAVIANVPDSRLNDVVLFDPADANYPVGFNILQAKSPLQKTILSSDLVATFRRMATSWGDVMDSVLANAILAFVESSRGGTLFELKRFLVEKEFREEFLDSVTDDAVRYFWENDFPLVAGKPAASILIRLDSFLRQSLIRNIVCQKDNRLDFRGIMDGRKILLVKLSQGLIGEENAYLLGTMLVSRIYQAALSRQEAHCRPYFWLYLDEFHHFITPSMERILSGSRKYNLGLVLAHQEFRQLQARSLEVASSVLSNCYTRVCFRLGDTDAEKFAGGFSFFDAKALQNLGVGDAIARVERADFDFNMTVTPVPDVEKNLAAERTSAVIDISRRFYAKSAADVETELAASRPVRPAAQERKRPVSTSSKDAAGSHSPTPPSRRKVSELQPEIVDEHRYLQKMIKRIAEKRDFIATIEADVLGGAGKVDVTLERDGLRIACEIALKNTLEYEIQNIHKCFAAGFDRVVVISTDPRHLERIRKQAEPVIEANHFKRLHFLEPESFHLFLESLAAVDGALDMATNDKVKGYRVKTTVLEIPESEKRAKRNVILDILSRVTHRKKTNSDD